MAADIDRQTATTVTAATTTASIPLPAGPYQTMAAQALQDLYSTWWTGTPDEGNVVRIGWGIPGPPFDQDIWEYGMLCFGIYTYWQSAQGADQAARLQSQYAWTVAHIPHRTSNFGGDPNIAVDDSGWNAMYFMQTYLATGNTGARDDALAIIQGAYNYYKDGDTANGLWYPAKPPSQGYTQSNPGDPNGKPGDNRTKAVYSVGLLSAALDFLIDAKSHDANWQTTYAQLYKDTLNIYNWSESHLLRSGVYTVTLQDGRIVSENCSDNLYWCGYNEGNTARTELNGPDGGLQPNGIQEAGSVSGLFGNMGMAVCHAMLYRLTGNTLYRDRAVRTAAAITDSPLYNNHGVLVNDRDGWVEGTFAGRYVQEVLTLPGIREQDKQLMFSTADSIMQGARVQIDGKWYYKAEWSGGSAWVSIGTTPEQITTSASTANMVLAAGLLEKLEARD